jgi:hypothetical protein
MSGPADWRKGGESTRPDPKRVIASLPLAVFTLAPDLGLGEKGGNACFNQRRFNLPRLGKDQDRVIGPDQQTLQQAQRGARQQQHQHRR